MEIMEFVKTKEIKDMIERGKKNALLRCAVFGHDYHEVDGIGNGKICICCGSRPNKSLDPTRNYRAVINSSRGGSV